MTEYDGWHQPIKPKGEMMTVADLRELIQDDIICCVDGFSDAMVEHDDREDLKNMICQIVVDRIDEFERGK